MFPPQTQFASVSMLLQCRLHSKDDGKEEGEEWTTDDPCSFRLNDDPVDVDALNDDSLTAIPRFTQPRNIMLRDGLVVVSPMATLHDHACQRCLDGLHRLVAREFGFRDDVVVDDFEDNGDNEDGGRFGPDAGALTFVECIDDDSSRKSGRVRFHDDTKGPPQDSHMSAVATSHVDAAPNPNGASSLFRCDYLKVRAYRPPRRDVGSPLGITLFYLAVHVGDRTCCQLMTR